MFLEKILHVRKQQIDVLKKEEPIEALKRQIERQSFAAYSMKAVLKNNTNISLIGEIKRASPSKGVLNKDLVAKEQARQYEMYGVDALSVLTESHFFKGSYEDLIEVRKTVKCPLLNKDFIIDTWQVYKAKAIGATCILLIVSALEDEVLHELYTLALTLGLEVVVEVHNLEELKKAIKLEEAILGINNRDLHTFHTTIKTTQTLVKYCPKDRIVISESGINTHLDVASLKPYEVDGILVGEGLVKAKNLEEQIRQLKKGGRRED